LRALVLGETWVLPGAIAALLGSALVVRELAPGFWADAGGLLLLGGVAAALLLATRGR
jgi:hypothetical protein